jgi:hypothetical protein
MKSMPIVWKRLVKNGETCTRCGETHHELEGAVAKLAIALNPLGIEPKLEIEELNEVAFKTNPSESNRVWIAGKPVEEWLGAGVGMSRCCSVCGDSDCRTLELGDRTFEAIPEELFIKAGLMAASQWISPASAPDRPASRCSSSSVAVPCTPSQERAKGSCCSS